ncbi:centromere-associated protein E-like isoform X2 [Cimex lectularius]|uniref:Uncharacterized protein n=1 Tax=Cimex lectularius TaxID=79782 RepID=A0A8I6S9A3_CIMLE|nr:centromere-associated protein E-like isoform X2 [Cimex lectularius]
MYEEEDHINSSMSDTLSTLQSSLESIEQRIKAKMGEARSLAQVTAKQLDNMRDLQGKCEAELHALENLPKAKQAAMERYNEGCEQLSNLQAKQIEINDVLDRSMHAYDSNYMLVENVKGGFEERAEYNQKCRIAFNKDVEDMEAVCCATNAMLKQNFSEKKTLLAGLKDADSSDDESLCEEIKMFDMQIGKSSCKLENLERTLSEMKKQWETTKMKSESIKSAMDEENARFALNLEEWNITWKKEDEKLKEINRELEEKLTSIDQLKSTRNNITNRLATERRLFSSLQQELNYLKSEETRLKEEFGKIARVKSDLAETSVFLDEKKTLIDELKTERAATVDNFNSLCEEESRLSARLSKCRAAISMKKTDLERLQLEMGDLEGLISKKAEGVEDLKRRTNERRNLISQNQASLKKKIAEQQLLIYNNNNTTTSKEKLIKELIKELKLLKIDFVKKEKSVNRSSEELRKIEIQAEKQKCVQIEIDMYYEIYNKKMDEKVELEKEIVAVKGLKNEIERKRKLIECISEEKQKIVQLNNDLLQEEITRLHNLKDELTVKIERQKENISVSQYEFFSVRSELKDIKQDLSIVNAITDLASCENSLFKSFLYWAQTTAGIVKQTKPSSSQSTTKSQTSLPSKYVEQVSTVDEVLDMELDDDEDPSILLPSPQPVVKKFASQQPVSSCMSNSPITHKSEIKTYKFFTSRSNNRGELGSNYKEEDMELDSSQQTKDKFTESLALKSALKTTSPFSFLQSEADSSLSFTPDKVTETRRKPRSSQATQNQPSKPKAKRVRFTKRNQAERVKSLIDFIYEDSKK